MPKSSKSSQSDATSALNPRAKSNDDWFYPAIATDGSVRTCLLAVQSHLNLKIQFTESLLNSIAELEPGSLDRVTELSSKVRQLENTLKFRLTILSPDRKGAWFRPSTATSGPFKESLLSDPVFSPYHEVDHSHLARGFMLCWVKENLVDYPLKASESSLWLVLLKYNFELASISKLSDSFPNLLDLPEKLPDSLESRTLRGFLTNVKAEISACKARLSDCYRLLLNASETFWRFHATAAATKDRFTDQDPMTFKFNHRTKQSTKETRSPTIPKTKPKIKTTLDMEALRFMGFGDFPDIESLKNRYHSMAREMHPDRPTGSEHRFKMLNRSYRHLTRVLSQ